MARILEECRENGAKAIIFSEWERMLQLVRDLCREMGIRHAWHTGSVPQPKRRAEINLFKNDPDCLVFLSTDSGSTGLNLQVASVVVNCDLPWNPAKLEQRIGRAWRKHQTKPVTVLNLVSKNTIEERMLGTLADKKALADGLLDLDGDLDKIRISRGGQKFLEKLQILTTPSARRPDETPKPHLPVNRTAYFAQQAESLLKERLVRCEEQFPEEGSHCVLLAVVEGDAEQAKPKLQALHEEVFSRNNRDPLAPVQLQVIDRATHEALEQLLAAGLIQKTMRASRRLDGVGSAVSSGLTEEQLAAVKKWKELSAKQTKAAAMLATCELESAAANMLQEAVLAWAKGMAVENGLPAPDSASALLDPPYVFGLDAHFPKAKEYLQSPAVFCPALVAELQLRTSSAAVEES